MTLEDFTARIGGSVKRRYKNGDWREVEVKDERYVAYYLDLMNHGYEYEL